MLSRLGRARLLSAAEWAQVLKAVPILLLVRTALSLVRFTRVHALLTRRPSGTGGLSQSEVEELSRAVARASLIVPKATCLTQALTLQLLLRNRGEPSRVEIGFLRTADDELKGHAWLVNREKIVIGGKGATNFERSLTLEG